MDKLEQQHAEMHSPCSVKVIVDDLTLTGTWASDESKFFCTVTDTSDLPADEKVKNFHATEEQFDIIVHKLITGDDSAASYDVIGALFNDFPNNLRPIP